MGITDAYAPDPPPPPDPNAPVIPWGGAQSVALMKQQAAQQSPMAPLDALGQKLQQDQAARANAINFSGGPGGPGGGAGGGLPSDTPLNFGSSQPQYATIKAHDVQLASDAGMLAKQRSADAAKAALGGVAQAQVGENEANQQEMAGMRGQMRGAQMEQESADKDTMDRVNKAHDAYAKASDIDPDHYQSSMKTGKRVMLTIAGALTQMGMGLQGNHGKNPVLEQIEEETKRDIDAQKNARDKKLSLYHLAREQGLDEKQAHAMTYQKAAEQAKLGLDAAVMGNHSPVLTAKAEEQKAVIDDAAADYMNKAFGRAQQQTVAVGGGSKWTDKMATEAVDLMKADHDKGGNMTIQQAQKTVATSHNVPFAGGPEGSFDRIAGANAGAGRQAGVQIEHKRLLGRYESAVDQIDKAIGHLQSGYSYGEDEKWGGVKQNIASEVGLLMHGGSSEGAVQGQLEHLGDLNQTELGQKLRGHSTVSALQEIKRQLIIKKAQEEEAGKAVMEGRGFGGSAPPVADIAAETGAVE